MEIGARTAKYSRDGATRDPCRNRPLRGSQYRSRAHLALRGGGPRVPDGEHRRGHAADGLRPLHHRVAADHGRRAAADRSRLAAGLRQVPRDPAVPARQPRHEPGSVQVHLLVGMDPSLSRAADRRRVPGAVPVLSGDRADPARDVGKARRHLRVGRAAGRARLVHGELRPRHAHRRQPVPACAASGARDPDLRRAVVGGVVAGPDQRSGTPQAGRRRRVPR